ncbi:MAG: hypothetical protein J6R47_01180 [Acholeplasmatales bacterium]|nr:hypothetical protein [Acholeplasmatales bacterium]
MSYPNNNCGECPVWLAMDTLNDKIELTGKCCTKCKIFTEQRFIRHIPSKTCYPLEPDGETVIICGCILKPIIDGDIFWEYVDSYYYKPPTPVDPIEAALLKGMHK